MQIYFIFIFNHKNWININKLLNKIDRGDNLLQSVNIFVDYKKQKRNINLFAAMNFVSFFILSCLYIFSFITQKESIIKFVIYLGNLYLSCIALVAGFEVCLLIYLLTSRLHTINSYIDNNKNIDNNAMKVILKSYNLFVSTAKEINKKMAVYIFFRWLFVFISITEIGLAMILKYIYTASIYSWEFEMLWIFLNFYDVIIKISSCLSVREEVRR